MNSRVLLTLVAIAIVRTASAGNEGDDAKKIQGTWAMASA